MSRVFAYAAFVSTLLAGSASATPEFQHTWGAMQSYCDLALSEPNRFLDEMARDQKLIGAPASVSPDGQVVVLMRSDGVIEIEFEVAAVGNKRLSSCSVSHFSGPSNTSEGNLRAFLDSLASTPEVQVQGGHLPLHHVLPDGQDGRTVMTVQDHYYFIVLGALKQAKVPVRALFDGDSISFEAFRDETAQQ